MGINWRILNRKLHRWGGLVVALPLLLVLVTGLLLQLKKELPWVQPPTARGKGKAPAVSFDALLAAVRSVPQAEVSGWGDIDRLDVRPGRGVVKVQSKNRWEVQVDLETAEVLQVAYRRSDAIESLHDGSWFGETVKSCVFLPAALAVLGLWATGMYLFFLPWAVRWSRRKAPAGGGRVSPPAV